MKKTVLLSFILLAGYNQLNAQTLKGNTALKIKNESHHSHLPMHTDRSASKAMKYGNVAVYDKDNNLIRSVLTDLEGNYELDLADTGTYTIEVKYAGYETIEETIEVLDKIEIKADFSLSRDGLKKERVLSEMVYSMEAGYVDGEIFLSNNNSLQNNNEFGKGLTAGEINDFGKWELWNDYLNNELSTYQKTWRINPQNRYVVQLTNNQKSPLVGAKVQLIGVKNEVIWESKSDNTGKAELWGAIEGNGAEIKHIIIDYFGIQKTIRNPKKFKKGINNLKINSSCGASNLVEIAFVVDATGSMSDEINFIKRDLNKIMFNAQNLYNDVSIRYGSVFYKDSTEDYVTKHKDFTDVLSEALVYIDEQFAGGGGDMPEAVDAGLDVAINQLSWSEDTRTKLLFLILDAPAHTDEKVVHKLNELTKKAAKKGIKIIPITGSGINKSGEYLMRALALGTNGTYLFLTDHSGIGNGHIEPTIDEYEIKLLTERVSGIIKSNIYYPKCEEDIPEFELNYPDSVVTFTMETGQIFEDLLDPDSLNNEENQTNKEEIHNIEWKYYPNPTRDYVTIESPEIIEYIYLTDLSGKILQRVNFNDSKKITLYLGDYPTGIYLLRYPVGKQWVSGKVVLVR